MISITLDEYLRRHVAETISGYAVATPQRVAEIQAYADWANHCHIEQYGDEYKVWTTKSWREAPERRQKLHTEVAESHHNNSANVEQVMKKVERLKKAGLTKSMIKLLGDDIL